MYENMPTPLWKCCSLGLVKLPVHQKKKQKKHHPKKTQLSAEHQTLIGIHKQVEKFKYTMPNFAPTCFVLNLVLICYRLFVHWYTPIKHKKHADLTDIDIICFQKFYFALWHCSLTKPLTLTKFFTPTDHEAGIYGSFPLSTLYFTLLRTFAPLQWWKLFWFFSKFCESVRQFSLVQHANLPMGNQSNLC